MWTNYRTRVFYYLFSECAGWYSPSECAGWYSPWSDGQAYKIQHLCQLSQEKLFSMADLQRSNLNHGWWAEAWPKENSFLLFQEELCQGSKSCLVFWLCVWAFSLSSQRVLSCEYHHWIHMLCYPMWIRLYRVSHENKCWLQDFDMNCDDITVEFDVFLTLENLIRVTQEGLLKKFKLITTISTTSGSIYGIWCLE